MPERVSVSERTHVMRSVSLCLLALVLSLLLVGFVSGTPIRHLIQATPGVVVLVLLAKGHRWAPYSALPLFVFWFVIMTLIWLFLLGIAKVVTGKFTPAEVVLTLMIGLSCMAGLWASIRDSARASGVSRIIAFAVFLAFQIGAMWLSLQPLVARR